MKTKLPIDTDIKAFLDEKVLEYNNPAFVEFDPISVPHRYSLKEDIEIAGFLAATISWGSRPQIVKAGHKIMDIMGDSPVKARDPLKKHAQKAEVYRCLSWKHLSYNIFFTPRN